MSNHQTKLTKVYVNFPPFNTATGSMGQYAKCLSTSLVERGYQVIFCSIGRAMLGTGGIYLPPCLMTSFHRLNTLLLYIAMVFEMLGGGKGDRIIVNVSQEYIFPFFLAQSVNIIHDTIQLEYPRNRKIQSLLAFSWYLARRSRLNICVSNTTAADLRRLGIVAHVSRCFFDLRRFREVEEEIWNSVAIELDAIWCGTLATHKNIDLYFSLCRLHPEMTFGVVLPSAYIAEASKKGLPGNVRISSSLSQEDYIKLLLSSRVLISTSLKEGYGMPPMEAALVGVPVLLSDIPVYREIYGTFGKFFDLNIQSLNREFLEMRGAEVSDRLHPTIISEFLKYQGTLEELVEAIVGSEVPTALNASC